MYCFFFKYRHGPKLLCACVGGGDVINKPGITIWGGGGETRASNGQPIYSACVCVLVLIFNGHSKVESYRVWIVGRCS